MLLLLIACSGKPADTSADQPDTGCDLAWYVDADHDGFGAGEPTLACDAPLGSSALAGDCDDGDPGVYPGAPETCDGVDQDCDDQIDEDAIDATDWYTDADGDGFGVGEAVSACTAPAGSAPISGDCDDTDPTVYPGAVETWYDGVDSDCDGDSDQDADGDGYDAGGTDGTDCDDGDPAVYPGATEQCEDGVDQDCDGRDAHCRLSGAVDAEDADSVLYGNQWAGHSGYAIDAMPGLAGGDAPTIIVGSPEEQDGGWAAGAVQLWKGDPVGDYNLDDDATIFGHSPSTDFGEHLSATCDATGDGLPDLLVVIKTATETLEEQGKVYLFSGPITADGTLDDATWTGAGAAAYDYFGYGLDSVGDVNQDGVCDWLVGAPLADNRGSLSGSAYLFLGPVSGAHSADSAHARIDGARHDMQMGMTVAGVGDTNGDGAPEFALQAYADADLYGTILLFTHVPEGVVSVSDADAVLTGEESRDVAGVAIASAGDHDGDGYGDLLVGANHGDGGATYLVLGPVTGARSLADAHAEAIGTVSNMASGYALDNAGDVDADGHLDVLVGASRFMGSEGVEDQGAAYLIYGPMSGTLLLDDSDAMFLGENSWDYFGLRVLGAGDLDDDGFDDIAISAIGYPSAANKGAVYIWGGGDGEAASGR